MKKKQEEAKEILKIKEEEAKKEIDRIVRIKKEMDKKTEEDKKNKRKYPVADEPKKASNTTASAKASNATTQVPIENSAPINNTANAMAVSRIMGESGMDANSIGTMVNTMLSNQEKGTPTEQMAKSTFPNPPNSMAAKAAETKTADKKKADTKKADAKKADAKKPAPKNLT